MAAAATKASSDQLPRRLQLHSNYLPSLKLTVSLSLIDVKNGSLQTTLLFHKETHYGEWIVINADLGDSLKIHMLPYQRTDGTDLTTERLFFLKVKRFVLIRRGHQWASGEDAKFSIIATHSANVTP